MRFVLVSVVVVLAACGGAPDESGPEPRTPQVLAEGQERPASCPEQAPAPDELPNVRAEQRTLAYWLARTPDADQTLLSATALAAHSAALLEGDDPPRQPPLATPLDPAALDAQLRERLDYLRGKFEREEYVEEDGSAVATDWLAPPSTERRAELRVALANVSLRCAPRAAGYYTPSRDLAFDRNNCSTIRAQEPVELLGRWGPMWLARTGYALGWVAVDAQLSPSVPEAMRAPFVAGARMRLQAATTLAGAPIPAGTSLPLVDPDSPEGSVYVGTEAGVLASPVSAERAPLVRPLTRAAVLEEAFALLDTPYGWGGREGGRDCSRFLLDVFGSFGLPLPRHSGRQAMAGTFSLDVAEVPSTQKQLLLDAAWRRGVVLLHFPGHIMLYLGRSDDGRPYAIHSFSEYVEPCEGLRSQDGDPIETLRRVDRVTVSDLSLGEGSSRSDFLSRVSRIVVLGHSPGPELQGAAQVRPPAPIAPPSPDAACDDTVDAAVFRTPFRANAQSPLRVIVTTTEDPGPVELALFDAQGERVTSRTRRTGGPPFGYWTEIERPSAGRWTAMLADGPRVVACERFVVARHRPEILPHPPETPAWVPAWSWERDTENLFAAFVGQLFREPALPEGQDTTWHGLQVLLDDRERNLLHDHLLQGEEEALDLVPDCADLPYFLRAYFAWKLRLPFGWRQCRRGREGRPPECAAEATTNLMLVEGPNDVQAFRQLVRILKQNVHSSTQRTVPRTDASDVYPVPLTREALRPGTVFADPYGHIIVVAAWLPQTLDSYGMLVGADAQPDGTIGRRRFWRGSFLFTPETAEAGAGFKAWRPLTYDRREQTITLLTNDELRSSRVHTRYDEQQYDGSLDDFYDRVDALINPRPLDADIVQASLVDALEEGVTRRVSSVDNGETFMRERGFRAIEMPEGAAIFQTEGPWEDYSTPSRDMRLLISIDAVLRFPDQVAANPERYGLRDDVDVDARRGALRSMLEARSFQYTRSDGSQVTLTLQDVADRKTRFEMAYNPNDCVEIRWAAPEGSDEQGTCRRHAPSAQRQRMARLRDWFATRQRPAR